ncbi:hotdog fold thioesterase [Gemmatimonas aurantiaca]|uniref:PaaI family thioesterase n=1 Tax=Gemmatimonas aurantiaca TaxID=173480 RepID=UPI00301C8942
MSDAAAVVQHLMEHDAFSQWMGAEVLEAAVGRSVIRMPVRADMVNGFGTLHGGVLFAFADSAFAFATNARGMLSVAVDCSISFPVAVRPGDVLTAAAVEQSTTNRLAFCEVTVTNQDDVAVGYFRGTVYRTTRPHVISPVVSQAVSREPSGESSGESSR